MPANARHLIDAFLGGDMPSAAGLLAPDARYCSPIADYEGAERIGAVWNMVSGVVQDTKQISIYERDQETVVFFTGTIKERSVDGVVRTISNDSDRVSDLLLMIRPLDALRAGLADIKR